MVIGRGKKWAGREGGENRIDNDHIDDDVDDADDVSNDNENLDHPDRSVAVKLLLLFLNRLWSEHSGPFPSTPSPLGVLSL